ncbi:MAG: ABC transporter ATP-binding protein [Polyangiaceae bacterium]
MDGPTRSNGGGVSIRGLSVRFAELWAVRELSLEVPPGCLFGLLGPNGAGKTTTLSATAGLLEPSAGQILVGDVDVTQEPERVQRMLGVVPQSLALYPTLTVLDNLQLFAGLFGVRGAAMHERVEWGLRLAQLENKGRALVGTLSGGMKRRLNLSCALLHDPSVIICDEPTTGVDPQSRNHIFDTIRSLHAEGRTVVYTTHYMEEVEALCQRVAIMDHGKVLVEDELEALLAKAGGAAGTAFRVELDAERSAGELMERLRDAGLPARVQAERANLERVFLDLTGRALRDSEAPSAAEDA